MRQREHATFVQAYLTLSQHQRWMGAVHAPRLRCECYRISCKFNQLGAEGKNGGKSDSVDLEEAAHILSRLA